MGSSLRAELPRKIVHIAMGGCALLLRWVAPWQAALLAAAALAFNLLALHRLTGRSLLRPAEREGGYSAGIVLYPTAVLALIVVFRGRLELAAATWGLLAFGDGMATLAGLWLGGPRLPWNRGKSWAGFVAFTLYGTAAAAFLLRFTQQAVLDAAGTGRSANWIGASFLADHASSGVLSDPAFLLAGCFVAALVAGFVESLDTGVDDNVLVPLFGGAVLFAATLVEPFRLAGAAGALGRNLLVGAGVNTVLAVAAFVAGGVARSGAIVGWLLGTALFTFGGWRGFLLLLVFFVVGTATTRWGYERKIRLGIAQERGGRRGARNAVANTSAGVAFAFLAAATSHPSAFTLALVAAFATAACDTASSEIGQAWGRRHVLVTTLRRVRAGTEGAVSLEGTLGGIAAAVTVAASALACGLVDVAGAGIVVVAAFFGALLESYLGATLESRGRIDNELVNFTNTVAGAGAACLLSQLVR